MIFFKSFKPIENKLGKLKKRNSSGNAVIKINHFSENESSFSFSSRTQKIESKMVELDKIRKFDKKPVFIPTKEVISFYNGFVNLYDEFKIPFDEPYKDIYNLFDLPEVCEDKLKPTSKWILGAIEKICNGKFHFEGGTVKFISKEKDEFSPHMIAEGFRKFGILYRLIETKAINPGTSGTLFWDEPESNLNPKLLNMLIKIILDMSRNGLQIIIATHDYVFLKELDLQLRDSDLIKFHNLSYDDENKIVVDSTEEYMNISSNAIDCTFENIIDREIERSMGGLGK